MVRGTESKRDPGPSVSDPLTTVFYASAVVPRRPPLKGHPPRKGLLHRGVVLRPIRGRGSMDSAKALYFGAQEVATSAV